MDYNLLSVVIFSHERRSQLEVAVQSAVEAHSTCGILIVDDASESPEMVEGLVNLEQHNRVTVYRRRSYLRHWNQRGGFYPNMRFAVRTVQTPFALFMEDDQQIVRHLENAELEEIAACMGLLKSPFMGVTFAHSKETYLPAENASRRGLYVKSAQAAYSTNGIVHMARLREHRFRIGPSAQATDSAAAAYFGPHPVWPAPLLAYRPGDHGFRFGRPVGIPQAMEDARMNRYFQMAVPEVARLKSMFPDVPTVAEFLSTMGSVDIPTSFVLRGSKVKQPVFRRLWYFCLTRLYGLRVRIQRSLRRGVGNELVVLVPGNVAHARLPDVA